MTTNKFSKANVRRRIAGLILAFLCLSLPGLAQSRDLSAEKIPEKRRVALVIGNASYPGPGHKLANPINDAVDLGAALERLGFQVRLGKDLSKQAMEDQVDKFVNDLHEGDVALFYFAGHGVQLNGENLLAPSDIPALKQDDPKGLLAACFRFDKLQQSLEHSKAGLSIMVMDACRTNPYPNSTRTWDQGGLAPVDARLGSYVVFAASPGQEASDNPREKNGLFAKFLLENLQHPPPLSQVFRKVRDDVFQASHGKQTPYLVDQATGDFSFVAPAVPVPQNPAPSLPLPRPQPAVPASSELMEQGLRLYHQDQCQEALNLFDRATRADPRNAFAQNAAGVANVCLNRYNQAIERFDMAIELRPDYAAAYLNRGGAYASAGEYKLAVEDYSWAVEQEPGNSVFYIRRGQAYFNLLKYVEALADFNRAIGLDPASAEAFHGRGLVLYQRGNYRAAANDFQAALERNANLTAARQDLERAHRHF